MDSNEFAIIQARFGVGGNNPPEPLTAAQVTADLVRQHGSLTSRRDELVNAITAFLKAHPVIDTEDLAASAAENLAMTRRAIAMTKESHRDAKDPYLIGGRAVDAWFRGVREDIEQADANLRGPATAYADRIAAERRAVAVEEARKRQVEADAAIAAAQAAATAEAAAASSLADAAIAAAKVAEAAHALATGKVGAHSRTTGIYGSTSSLQERWVCEIEDDVQVPREHCVASQSSLDRAVAAGARIIPGCRIYLSSKLVSR